MAPIRQRRRRSRTKGVAALEFALSLTFLAPMMCAAIDFGYYFYVGSSVEEAALAGVRQAVVDFRTNFPGDASCNGIPGLTDKTGTITLGQSTTNGEAYKVMAQPPLNMPAFSGGQGVAVQVTCDDTPVPVSWHILVRADFPPLLKLVAPFMPAGTPGNVRYKATLTSN
jgi:Flp pilus assembly protein TadG